MNNRILGMANGEISFLVLAIVFPVIYFLADTILTQEADMVNLKEQKSLYD